MENELCYLNRQYVPFPKTKAEREKTGDPRLSLEERHKDREEYVRQVSRAARILIDERYLLPTERIGMVRSLVRSGRVGPNSSSPFCSACVNVFSVT